MQTCLEKMVVQFIFVCKDLLTSFLEIVLWEGCPSDWVSLKLSSPFRPRQAMFRAEKAEGTVRPGQWPRVMEHRTSWPLHIPSPVKRIPLTMRHKRSLLFNTQPSREGPYCQQSHLIVFPCICLPLLINNDIRSFEERRRELPIGDLICYNQTLLACRVTQYK